MAIWVFKDGVREGPYEERDVRELIYEGTYHDVDQAVRDGDPTPRTIGELLGRTPGVAPMQVPQEGQALPPRERLKAGESAPSPQAELAVPPVNPPPLPAAPPAGRSQLPETLAIGVPAPVTVVDFSMPFGSMVIFMVKWALAAIPAVIIIITVAAIFWTAVFTSVAGIFASLLHHR